jgi:SagB-type dehydrogenase family enzyme
MSHGSLNRSRPNRGERLPYGRYRRIAPVFAAAISAILTACGGPDSPSAVQSPEAAVALPPPIETGTMSVEEAIRLRRSVREYADQPLTDAEIGQLLWAAQGITAPKSGRRAAPSAGALYPLEVYVMTADGLVHYLPEGHRTERVLAGDLRRELAAASASQEYMEKAPAILIITGFVSRTRGKYGDRAEQYVLQDCGHAAQNVLLQAVAQGLRAVSIGGFTDDKLHALLGLAEGEQAYEMVAVGHPKE